MGMVIVKYTFFWNMQIFDKLFYKIHFIYIFLLNYLHISKFFCNFVSKIKNNN